MTQRQGTLTVSRELLAREEQRREVFRERLRRLWDDADAGRPVREEVVEIAARLAAEQTALCKQLRALGRRQGVHA